jgi:hypothetical protein
MQTNGEQEVEKHRNCNRDVSYRIVLKPGMDILIPSSIDICQNFAGITRCDRYNTTFGNADWRKKGAYTNRRLREAPSAYGSTKSISLDRRPGH